MTTLHQIGSIEALLSNSPLSTSKLWWRSVDTISGTELHAFVARMGYEGYGREARHNVEIALGEVRRAVANGEIEPVPMLDFRLPGATLTLGDVRSLLARTTPVRRKAILFALEAGLTLKDVLELRWDKALKLDLTEQARWVLLGMPRHIKSNLVFWEYSRFGTPFPLLGLIEEFNGMTLRMDWEEFARQYQRAIPYDYDAEWITFKSAIDAI